MKGTDLKEVLTDEGWRLSFFESEPSAGLIEELNKKLSLEGKVQSWERLQSSAGSSLWLFSSGGCTYVFKEFLSRGLFESVGAVFRGTRGRRAWRAALILEEAGFLTPQSVVLGERRGILCAGGNGGNFMVTRFIEGSMGLAIFMKGPLTEMAKAQPKEAIVLRQNLARELGALVGRLHAKGIVHGDLRPNNILIQMAGQSGFKFYLIDNERNKLFREIPFALLVKNLVQIGMLFPSLVGRTDRMRFFKAYLEAFPMEKATERLLAKTVWTKTVERLKKIRLRCGNV